MYSLKNFSKAIILCKELLDILKQNSIIRTDVNLQSTYFNIALFYLELNDLRNTKLYLKLALDIKKEGGNDPGLDRLKPYLFELKSKLKVKENLLKDALKFSDSAIYYSKKNSDLKVLAGAYNQRAHVLTIQKKYKEANSDNELLKIIILNLEK